MGPHRADIFFRDDRKVFDKWGSRGELKLAVFGLFLAQLESVRALSGRSSILLVDDLTAELDGENVEKVMNRLKSIEHQVYVTTTDRRLEIPQDQGKMFHVKHGVVIEQGV